VLSGGHEAGVQFGGDAAEEYQVFIQLVLQLGFVDGKLEQPHVVVVMKINRGNKR
jgi:hypothetical protein